MKKIKTYLVLLVILFTTALLTACGCNNNKTINPTGIIITETEKNCFVGNTFSIDYTISPNNATNKKVLVTLTTTGNVSANSIVSLSHTNFNSITGRLNVTATALGSVNIEFRIDGTEYKASAKVNVHPDAEILSVPQNLRYNLETGKVVFQSVPNTKVYKLSVNEEEFVANDESELVETHNVEFDLFKSYPVNYDTNCVINVKAIGDGIRYLDSAYGSNPINIYKVGPVINIKNNSGIITWDNKANATGYIVKVNDTQYEKQTGNSFDMNAFSAGVYEISIQAIANRSEGYVYDSAFSEPIALYKLESVANINIINSDKSYITFTAVENATSYEAVIKNKLTGIETKFTFLNTDERKITLDESYIAGEYEISIIAFGNANTTLKSPASTFNFNVLGVVENVVIENSVLRFDAITNAKEYEISFIKNGVKSMFTVSGNSFNLLENLTIAGVYEIYIRAIGEVSSFACNGSVKKITSNITKLAESRVNQINNLGVINFNSITNATGYEIYLDNTYIARTAANNYTFTNLLVGSHNVKIKALGNGTTCINSQFSNEFVFEKLGAITTSDITVIKDVIYWEKSDNANAYFVKENELDYISIGNVSEYTLKNPKKANTLSIFAAGNNTNKVNSDEVTVNVNQLDVPTGFVFENGEFTWESSSNCDYYAYLNGDSNGIKLATNKINNMTFNVENEFDVQLRAFPKEIPGNIYLSSNLTGSLNLTILNEVKPIIITDVELTNTKKITWNVIPNASAYLLSVMYNNTILVNGDVLLTNEYDIPNSWGAGTYRVSVSAIGDNKTGQIGFLTGKETLKTIYKLPSPRNLNISGNTLTYDASSIVGTVATATSYEALLTINGTTSIYNNGTSTSFDFNKVLDDMTGNVMISVRAIGEGNVLSSMESPTVSVLRLDSPILTATNGQVSWNAVGGGADVTYKIYIVEKGTSAVVTTTELTCEILNLTAGSVYNVYAVANANGYLSSNKSELLKVEKLNYPANFKIEKQIDTTRKFKWDYLLDGATKIASGFTISEITNPSVKFSVSENSNEFNFSYSSEGTYKFAIMAKGGKQKADGTYYLNSDNSSKIDVVILKPVSNIVIKDNLLTWKINANSDIDKPDKFSIEIIKNGESSSIIQEVSGASKSFDINSTGITAGTYTVKITSISELEYKVNSMEAVKTDIVKIDANESNLRVESGTLVWDEYTKGNNVTYQIYYKTPSVDGNLKTLFTNLTDNTCDISSLKKDVLHEIYIKITASNLLYSDVSFKLEVIVLNDITNFKMIYSESDGYKFTWDAKLNAEKYMLLNKNDNTEIIIDKSATEYILPVMDSGDYTFQLKAIGGSYVTNPAYISGKYGEELKISVLPKVTFRDKQIINGAVVWVNQETTNNVGATNIKIIVTEIVSSGTPIVYTDILPSETTSFNFVLSNGAIIPSGNYTVEIYSMGNTNSIVTSVVTLIPNVTKLDIPNNVEIINGKLSWGSDNTNCKYELYIDNVKIELPDNETTYFDEMLTAGINKSVKLRAVFENTIYSDYTTLFTINRLTKITDLHIEKDVNNVSRVYWSNVSNAAGYRLYVGQYEQLKDLHDYNFEEGYFEINGAVMGTTGFTIPNVLLAGDYRFYVVAVGDNKALTSDNTGYLPSSKSHNIDFSVLSGVGFLTLNNGAITWDMVTGVTQYKVEIFQGDGYTNSMTPIKAYYTGKTQVNFIDFPELTGGSYIVHVFAMGDGIYFITTSTSFSEIIVYKQSSNELKVLNGKLVWDMAFTNPFLEKLNGGNPLTEGDAEAIKNIVNGNRNGIKHSLLKNLYGTFVIEVSLTNSHVQTVSLRISPTCTIVDGVGFRFEYAVELAGGETYKIKIGNSGNKVEDNLPLDGDWNLSSGIDYMLNLVYGAPSNELDIFILPAPRTPTVEGQTSIQNNTLYWSPVTVVGNPTYVPTYKIVAKPISSASNNIEKIVTDLPTNKICSIKVENLNLNTNIEYTLYVYALGTLDSTRPEVTAPYYLTSSYYGSCQVTMLLSPTNLTIKDGIIQFDAINGPVVLNIWTDTNSTNFENASSSGKIKRAIEITEESALSNPNILDGRNGYILEDNEIMNEIGEYRMSIYAKGDGVKTISSKIESSTIFFKFPTVDNVSVSAGEFIWKHVKVQTGVLESNPVYAYPENYKVTVFRTVPTLNSDITKVEEFIVGVPFGLSEEFMRYELPDNSNFEGYIKSGEAMHTAKYSIKVSAYGNISTADDDKWLVTGNSEVSGNYERLKSPDSVAVTNGLLSWKAVTNAYSYEVYINDSMVEDYELVSGTTSITMEIGAAYPASVYKLKVRAIASFDDRTYLNSTSNTPITASKLEKPALRIEEGTLKWNTSELAFVTASSVDVLITGPSSYRYETKLDYNNIANTSAGFTIKGDNSTTPSGAYTAVVRFNGATGLVNNPDNENYYWLSSDPQTILFTRLASPKIDIASEEKKETINGEEVTNVRNYVYFNAVANATKYNVVATTKAGDRKVLFNLVLANINDYPDFNYNSGTDVIEFNLNAISKNDAINLDKPQFGTSYSIYVEAYANDGDTTTASIIYAMSNNSNTLDIEVPQTPIIGKLDSNTGTITWQNVPADTKTIPVLEVSYDIRGNGTYVTEIVDTLSAGDTSYQLKMIATNYKIRIKSKLNAESGGNAFQSEFSLYEQGRFSIYTSGDGSKVNPYIVSNKEQFVNISKRPNSSFRLDVSGKVIDFKNETWAFMKEFNGILDGNDTTISNINFKASGDLIGANNVIALFGKLGKDAVFKNIVLNVNVTGARVTQYGAVAIQNHGTIQNVKITGNTSFANSANIEIGAIVCYNYGLIKNVVNASNINTYSINTSYQMFVGGIAFNNTTDEFGSGRIEECGNIGNLSGSDIGGVAYKNTSIILASYNRDNNFTVNDNRSSRFVGGVVARNEGTVTYCYAIINNIDVTNLVSSAVIVGGLIGADSGTTKYIASYANIKSYSRSNSSGTITIGLILGSSTRNLNDALTQTATFENITCVEGSSAGISSLVGTLSSLTNITGITKLNSLNAIIASASGWAGGYYDISNSTNYLKLRWETTFSL